MLTSYEANFARSWGRKAKSLVMEHGREWFGVGVSDDIHSAIDWETTEGGGMVTAGVGGPLTGRGAELLIVDDPIKNAEQAVSEKERANQWDWWQSTASTRIEPGGCCIVITTRWHKDDLAGRLLAESTSGEGPPVRELRLSAICDDEDDAIGREIGEPLWPARWPLEALEAKRLGMEAYWWSSLYQQRPTRHGRTKWPDAYFADIMAREWPDKFELGVVAVDPSSGKDGGDYPAVVFVGRRAGKLFVEALMQRMPEEAVAAAVCEMVTRYRPYATCVEKNFGSFAGLLKIVARGKGVAIPRLMTIHNHEDKKLIRIPRLGPMLQRGDFQIRNTPGGRLLLQQLQEFPVAEHDDGPDAMEMACRLMQSAARGELEEPPQEEYLYA